MSSRALISFERRFEDWEITHPRQWIATTDRRTVAEFISEQTDKIVSAQLEAADRIIVSQDRITSGIDKVGFGLDRIADGLESLASAFEWGLSEVVWQLEQQRTVLEEILRVLQAPLDTQSKELRKRAEYAYRNGWIDDALEDFLESERKNRYDFTIHQSLGDIYLFHKKDSERALEYYEKAAKYATPESPYHASLALLHIGLINYLQGNSQKAYEATSKAIELSPNLYEAHYQHAQYCASLGKYDEAMEFLRKAIAGDRYYCLKADSEKDFDVMREQLRSFFQDSQNAAQDQARSEIYRAQKLISDAESYGLSIHGEFSKATNEFRGAKGKVNEAREFLRRESLFDCWDATCKARVAQKMAVDASVEYLSNQILNVERERDEKEEKLNKRLGFRVDLCSSAIVVALVVSGIIAGFLIVGGKFYEDILGSIIVSLGGVLLIPYLLFLLLKAGGGLICNPRINKNRVHYENRLARLRDNLFEVQTERNQLGIEERAKHIEDAEQYEDFLRKGYW